MNIRAFLVVLLSLSVSGSVLAVLVRLGRRLAGPRLSYTAGYYLWLLVLLRLVLPFGMPDSVMARVFAHSAAQAAAGPAAAYAVPAEEAGALSSAGGAGDAAAPQTPAESGGTVPGGAAANAAQRRAAWAARLPTLVFAVWAAGAAVVVARSAAAYFRLRAALRRQAVLPDPEDLAVFRQMFGQLEGLCRVRLVCSAAAPTPMLLGGLRPVLVLPAYAYCQSGQEARLRCLLQHEMTHHARRDPWYKWLVLAVRAAHWFNPLLPCLARWIEQDCELACDEAVAAHMTPAQRLCYGNTLLAFAGAAGAPGGAPVVPLAGGGKEVLRQRLQCSRHPTRRTCRSVCLAAALCLLFAGCGAVLGAAVPVHALDPGASASTAEPPPAQPPFPQKQQGAAADPAPAAPADGPAADELVYIRDYLPDVYVELKYATSDNLAGRPLYDFTEPMLRYGTVQKLAAVQAELAGQGYSLQIWDAYRPLAAQQALWNACPDPTYVSDPRTGYLGHTRGNTVDVTLVLLDGTPVEMPSGFDEFTALADRDYSDVPAEAAARARLLEQAMLRHGFRGYAAEWNHYSDETEYDKIPA